RDARTPRRMVRGHRWLARYMSRLPIATNGGSSALAQETHRASQDAGARAAGSRTAADNRTRPPRRARVFSEPRGGKELVSCAEAGPAYSARAEFPAAVDAGIAGEIGIDRGGGDLDRIGEFRDGGRIETELAEIVREQQ